VTDRGAHACAKCVALDELVAYATSWGYPFRAMKRALEHDEPTEQLRALVQTFVRRFGLLLSGQTPCGQPIPRSHAHALMALLDAKPHNRLAQAELGALLGIDKSNVARLCARMELLGHAVQARAKTDGRSRLVSLTPAGKALARSIECSSRARFRGILQSLPKKDHAVVFTGLAKLNDSLLAAPPRSHA
jgi:DNA-binding MarR family transcriptional regulator